MSGARPLSASFYAREAEDVARDLLGATLIAEIDGERCAGRIVETEAYPGPHDPASHAAASIGRTPRNDPMFGPPGSAYIHLNYGIHWCLNAVAGPEGYPAAVLIRALEPLEGMEIMAGRRGRERARDLCSGPGKLTQALGIGPELQRHPLERQPVYVLEGDAIPTERIARVPRVGITRGADRELRFYELGSEHVSRR